MPIPTQSVAIITGASRGLGLALASALADLGWQLVLDARGEEALRAAEVELSRRATVRAIPGDVADERHLEALVAAARELGSLEVLVHNASALGPDASTASRPSSPAPAGGPSPLPAVADYPTEALTRVFAVNVLAPLRLTQLALPLLRPGGRLLAITSDAAVEAYEGWGGYGASKAALEQLFAVLAREREDLQVYRVDPGDMNTQMQREAFPGQDVSDRPPPEDSVPGLLRLIRGELPSGRYEARALGVRTEVNA